MKLYFIPGLGFDHRIFSKLDLPGFGCEYLNWVDPLPGEGLAAYAKRFAVQIDEGETALIGHSFGGILAQEIAASKNVESLILLSSIKSNTENPQHFQLLRGTGLQRLFTKQLVIRSIQFWGKRYGYETEEEQALVKDMVNGYSNLYLRWALQQLSAWKGPPANHKAQLYQIHGDKDKTFPITLIHKPSYLVEGAGHFMVYNQADRINNILLEVLSS